MLPIQIAGLALAGTTLLSKYLDTKDTSEASNRIMPTLPQFPKLPPFPRLPRLPQLPPFPRLPQLPQLPPFPAFPKLGAGGSGISGNPVQSLIKGLSSSISRIKTGIMGEDYHTVLQPHLPSGAHLVKPLYPRNAGEVTLADLDGDKQDELIASYRLGNEIRTMVLKKQKEEWVKAAEINDTGYEALKYRDTADMTGEGKPHLLAGFSNPEKASVLHGYVLSEAGLQRVFVRPFHRLDIVDSSRYEHTESRAHLAVWNREQDGAYRIETLRWNGRNLEPAGGNHAYYRKKVLPYYAARIKRMPHSASRWYDLAEALANAGVPEDARIAADIGMGQDKDENLKEKFEALKKHVAM